MLYFHQFLRCASPPPPPPQFNISEIRMEFICNKIWKSVSNWLSPAMSVLLVRDPTEEKNGGGGRGRWWEPGLVASESQGQGSS